MEDFESFKGYNPEDEYEPIENKAENATPENLAQTNEGISQNATANTQGYVPQQSQNAPMNTQGFAPQQAQNAPMQYGNQQYIQGGNAQYNGAQQINQPSPVQYGAPTYNQQAQYGYQPNMQPQYKMIPPNPLPSDKPTVQPVPQKPIDPNFAPYPAAQQNAQNMGYQNNGYAPQAQQNTQYTQAYTQQGGVQQGYNAQPYQQQGNGRLTYQQVAQQNYQQQAYQQQATYQQPYQTVQTGQLSPNPYAQNVQEPKKEKNPPTSTGTKTYLIILCALLVALVAGFCIYIAASANKNNSNSSSNGNDYSSYLDGDGYDSYNSISYEDVSAEITLAEDNGDSQKRSDDNPVSVGTPDESAKNIVLEALPSDKDDSKYTTQSAYEAISDSVVTINCYSETVTENEKDIVSSGSGTIISEDGYIVTNAHVLGNSKRYAVNVIMNSGDTYQATIIGYDTWTDLAVIKIEASGLSPVTFGDSSLVNVGDDVIAIGSPGGVKFQNSLTKGIVSAVDRELSINKYVRYIQSDAAISPGNSGGPLCNIYSQVIGITTVKTVATNYENMSFSIPSETVEEIVGDLMRYGYVTGRCRVGLSGNEVTSEEIYYYGYPEGIIISAIDENGPLANSGLKEGDILTELDGEAITSFQDVYDVLADHKAGDTVTVKAVRPNY